MSKRIKVSKNFFLDELVDVVTYTNERDNGLSKIDPVIIDCLQLLRTLKGSSIGVNNWWSHWLKSDLAPEDFYRWVDTQRKIYQSSGYRAPWCKIGASKSAHKIGKAVDPKGDERELYKIVEENAKLFYDLGLRRLEDFNITNGWLHMDTSENNHNKKKIRIIGKTSHVKDINV